MNLLNGDCLAEMDKLIDRGIMVDAIITDPPYGTYTVCIKQ
jgi:DNA modification methylase